jgi:hypothetical protein
MMRICWLKGPTPPATMTVTSQLCRRFAAGREIFDQVHGHFAIRPDRKRAGHFWIAPDEHADAVARADQVVPVIQLVRLGWCRRVLWRSAAAQHERCGCQYGKPETLMIRHVRIHCFSPKIQATAWQWPDYPILLLRNPENRAAFGKGCCRLRRWSPWARQNPALAL